MKHIFTFAFLFIVAFVSAQQCRGPVADAIFQQNFNQIAVLRGDASKQVRAEQFVTANCVSSLQLKSIAQLFESDSIRLIVCKKAYPRVTDTTAFFVVYDAFATFSHALRLYDYVQHYKPVTGNVLVQPVTAQPLPSAPQSPVFPAWLYPDTVRSTASKGCAGPVITEQQFTVVTNNVFRQPTDESKIVAIESASLNNCLSMAQLMKLASMLTGDDNRLRVMKSGFARVYDQEHYSAAAVVFAAKARQDEWINYCTAYLTPPCVVSSQDFGPLLQQIKDKSFPADRLSLVKMMAKDRCFNTSQLQQIADQFTFDDERMEIFKLCYAKCPDKQNYYVLVDKLTFSTNKDELKRFINAGGK